MVLYFVNIVSELYPNNRKMAKCFLWYYLENFLELIL